MARRAAKRIGWGRRRGDTPAFTPWALAFLAVLVIELVRMFLGGSVKAAVVEAQFQELKAQVAGVELRLTKRVERVEDALRDHTDRTAIR